MKAFVLKDAKSTGNVYFRFFNVYTKEDEWTGVLDRATFWLHRDVAQDQVHALSMKGMDYWQVVEVDI